MERGKKREMEARNGPPDEAELARLNLTLVYTALHYAAEHGRTQQAVELLLRNPSLAFQLNPDGLTPLDLAIVHDQHETVRHLIRMNPELIGIQGGDGKTPLHRVAEKDDDVLLAEFLVTFPDAINELTIRGESAVHWALKKDKQGSFHVLYGWLRRTGRINVLRWRDWNDNTLLHVAAEKDQAEVIRILVKEGVPLNSKNAEGLTALNKTRVGSIEWKLLKEKGGKVSEEVQDRNYKDYFTEKLSLRERLLRVIWFLELKLTSEQRNVILVVAALICIATFLAMVQQPSAVSDLRLARVSFAVLNAISFVVSSGMIHMLLPSRGYNLMLHWGLYSLMIAYAALLAIFTEYTYFYWFLAVIFFIILMLKVKLSSMVRNAPSTIRDVSPFMNSSSMIMRCVQMDNSLV